MRPSRAESLAMLAVLTFAACDRNPPREQTAQNVERALRAAPALDPRVDYLLVPGPRSGHYDVDTSDALAILTENLLRGQRDPLRRAREELGRMGAEGLRVAARVIDTYFDDPQGSAHLRNALDVVHRSDHPDARALCLRLVAHRDPGLVALAVGALEKHGRPEDYDVVRALMDVIDPEFRSKVLQGFWALDRHRASLEFVEWLRTGERSGFADDCALRLAEAQEPDVVGRISPLWRAAVPRIKALLAAPCARAGDAEALEYLQGELASNEPWRRELAVTALEKARFAGELERMARTAESTDIRLRAINALAGMGELDERSDALRTNLSSADSRLSTACLDLLARSGDRGAIDRALALIESDTTDAFVAAMAALRTPMQSDPALAQRVLDVLARRREPEVHLPLGDQLRTLQAVGQVPLQEAARLLIDLSRTARGEMAGMPAERWLLQQAGNVGAAAQTLLFDELARETDAARRLDLIEALSIRGGAQAVELLARFVDSEAARPYEILLASERLIRMGSVGEVAPLLKRVVLRVEQADVRIALQSLLWMSYPAPR